MRRSRWNPQPFPSADPKGWSVYYDIDSRDPPSIKEVARAWASGRVRARDSQFHAHYSLKEIMRSAKPGNLLRVWRSHPSEVDRWQAFVREIETSGVMEPVMVEIDQSGEARLGEGNHRVGALLEIHRPYERDEVMVPVRFRFLDFYHEKQPNLTWATFKRTEEFYTPHAPSRETPREASSRRARAAYRGPRTVQSPEERATARKTRRTTSKATQAARRKERKARLRGERKAASVPVERSTEESTEKTTQERIDELMRLLF